MRTITTHHRKDDSTNAKLSINVINEEAGLYEITGHPDDPLVIDFGPHGVTPEALQAIIDDRIKPAKAAPKKKPAPAPARSQPPAKPSAEQSRDRAAKATHAKKAPGEPLRPLVKKGGH